MSESREEQQGTPSSPLYPTLPSSYPYAPQSPELPPPPNYSAPAGYGPPQSGYPGQPGYAPPLGYGAYPPYPPFAAMDGRGGGQGVPSSFITSQWAIWSLVCSLLSFITSGLTAIPGVIFGHLALREIRQFPWMRGRGMAIAGLIIGYLVIAFWVVIIGVIVVALLAQGGGVAG